MRLHETTDRIEKQVVLRAPRSRVWRALTDAEEFSAWFGVRIEGAFVPGSSVKGMITMSDKERMTVEMAIERVDPESRMSYRCLLYTSPSPRDLSTSRMPSSA